MEHQKKKKIPKDWHSQQEVILKAWGEACSCFSYMHFKAYHLFKRMNFRFMLPIIVISTVTGTANFAQDTFPENIRHIVPAVVGGFNLFAAILTTVAQFLKVSERLESHRVTAIHYGKLARNIRLELNLPISERSHDGSNMVEICRSEYDRLIEQAPPLPGGIMKRFEKEFKNDDISRPDISSITPMSIFDSVKEHAMISQVTKTFKSLRNPSPLTKISIVQELEDLRNRNLVSDPKFVDALPDDNQLDNDKQQHEEEDEIKDTPTE